MFLIRTSINHTFEIRTKFWNIYFKLSIFGYMNFHIPERSVTNVHYAILIMTKVSHAQPNYLDVINRILSGSYITINKRLSSLSLKNFINWINACFHWLTSQQFTFNNKYIREASRRDSLYKSLSEAISITLFLVLFGEYWKDRTVVRDLIENTYLIVSFHFKWC